MKRGDATRRDTARPRAGKFLPVVLEMHLNFRLVVPRVKMHFLFASPARRVASERFFRATRGSPGRTAKNRCGAFVRCHGRGGDRHRGGNVRRFEILVARAVLRLGEHVDRWPDAPLVMPRRAKSRFSKKRTERKESAGDTSLPMCFSD